jgi:hypothetical protein
VRRIRLRAGLLAVRNRDDAQKPWAKKGPGEVYKAHNKAKPVPRERQSPKAAIVAEL